MISVAEAYAFYAQHVSSLDHINVPLSNALHRFSAEDVRSVTDLPPFPQSAMDGYALRSADTAIATKQSPARLELIGEIPAGRLDEIPTLGQGQAMRIFTGGYVPNGADVVLRQEDARVEDGVLLVRELLGAGENVRDKGEEIAAGEVLISSGEQLTPGVLSALSVAGVGEVEIVREPLISVLTTGDEIVKPGQVLQPGEVYDANSTMISSWLSSYGYEQVASTPVLDTLEGTIEALERAFDEADVVITCGGVSVGDKDYVIPAAKEIGVEEVFWRVRQKPGKPLFFGMKGKQVLLGLPGNPGSVYVCLNVHGIHVLDRLAGAAQPRPHRRMARLAEPESLGPFREFWMRARTRISDEGEVWIDPLPKQSSHMITNLTECTALACIPEGEGILNTGSLVEWIPTGPGSKFTASER